MSLNCRHRQKKIAKPADTLAEFIVQYIEGVKKTMENIKELVQSSGEEENECCPNFHYFHFLSQVRMYYPRVREKMEGVFRQEYEMWKEVPPCFARYLWGCRMRSHSLTDWMYKP